MYYGYWVLAAGSLILAIGYSFLWYGFTVFFLPLSRDLGVSRTAISLLYGMGRIEAGVQGPVVGRLIDRFGPRWIIFTGGALTGIGFILLSWAQSYWGVLLIFVLVISVGYNTGFYHPVSTAINSWFIRRRATGFAVLDSVGSLGAVVLVPLLAYWVLSFGWRTGALMAGIITLVVALPLALPFHRSPESRGLHPDGRAPERHPGNPTAETALTVDFTVREAIGTANYWLLTLTTTLRLSVTGAAAAHMVPILVWKSVDEASSAYLVSLFAFGTIATPLLMGWLGDRWSKSQLSALGILVCVGGFLLLLRSSSPLALYSFPLTMAVALGTAPLNWSLVGDFYGRGSYGTLRGIMRMANGAGAFLAPVYAGWTFDHTGSYGEVLLVFAVVLLVSAFLFFLLAPPSQPRRS